MSSVMPVASPLPNAMAVTVAMAWHVGRGFVGSKVITFSMSDGDSVWVQRTDGSINRYLSPTATWTDSLPYSDDRTTFSTAPPSCSSPVQTHSVTASHHPTIHPPICNRRHLGEDFSPPWCWHSSSPMITKKRNGNRKENGENKRSP